MTKLCLSHLTPADYRLMSWKNGAGSTTELAIHPKESCIGASFLWRLSIASLTTSGPFSSFPGYDRIIILLSGNPMRLVHHDIAEQQLHALAPVRFRGEWATSGYLNGSDVQDFNVMVQRQHATAEAECCHLQKGQQQKRIANDVIFLFAWQASSQVKIGETELTLAEGESLLIEDARHLPIVFYGDLSILIVVAIHYLPVLGN